MKILFLSHRLPYAPNRGDRIRAYHMLKHLARDCEVHLFSLAERAELVHLGELRTWLASVTTATPPRVSRYLRAAASLAGNRPLTHVLLDAPTAQTQLADLAERVSPDVVLAYCSGMARFAVEGPLDRLPCVIDMVDVDSMKWRALGTGRGPLAWVYRREARVLSRFEGVAARHAAVTLVVNAREREALQQIAPSAAIEVVEVGIDSDLFASATPPAPSPEVVFCGVLDYVPNIEGVRWFVVNVWPLVRAQVPDAHLTLVGSRPTRSVRRLGNHAGVDVTGDVPDVRPYLWRAAVGVAPLLTARGIQNKVLEMLAAGLPVVTTPTVSAGLPASVLGGCRAAASPEMFAAEVIGLLRLSPFERRGRAAAANVQALSWKTRLVSLKGLLREAVSRATPPNAL